MNNFEHLGTGAVKDLKDGRDFKADRLIATAFPLDWSIPFTLPEPPNENQNGSGSCTAQSWSYYHWQFHKRDYSRKDLYSRIALPNQPGAYIRDGGLAIVNQGQATRDEVPDPSLETEEAMRSGAGTPAQEASDKELNSFTVPNDIDSTATAIREYNGVVFGLEGNWDNWQDIGNPNPPTEVKWSHALYLFGYHLHDNVKCVIAKSSWGTAGETTVHHIKENYFLTGHTFNPWTLIPKEQQNMGNMELVKKGQEYGFYLPCTTPEALISYGKNFGIDIPHSDDHTVLWGNLEPTGEVTEIKPV